MIADGPDPGEWTGLSGMADGWSGWLGAWGGYRTEADEYLQLAGDRVLVLGRMSGRGKTSGVSVETEFANLFAIRDGKVVRRRQAVVQFERDRHRLTTHVSVCVLCLVEASARTAARRPDRAVLGTRRTRRTWKPWGGQLSHDPEPVRAQVLAMIVP